MCRDCALNGFIERNTSNQICKNDLKIICLYRNYKFQVLFQNMQKKYIQIKYFK